MGALRILEIEIDNFKTFRHEVIPFLAGFTAISGPNGSGKSNILDALLWCLGLSSNRTLRAEKGTDLINNGSSRREARVTVRLGVDGATKEQPVAQRSEAGPDHGAEVAQGLQCIEVSRRIKESQPTPGNPIAANSTYYLNGRVASLTDIHDLLALHHISPSGYNVVMQGDVTSIIRMTGSERRKIIDEVAGVAEFDHRIDQARKELQAVFEQEERTALLLGELAARLDGLRVERDQALKYLELKGELKRFEL
ncbi:MAG: AAA family ATPase, partial [Candidatus Sericytochromatia bacterium]|nr:AAA family ATPase [Candidatus Tanganyikabacteria bacterium]